MPPVVLTSGLLAVPHGFPTRQGGHSAPPFDSFNLGVGVGDDPRALASNLALLESLAGVRPGHLARARQVHGTAVLRVEGPGVPPPGEADALWTGARHVAVAVATADCLPLLVHDASSGRVAAVHAGWKGALHGVLPAALEAMEASPAHLAVALGPCIRACCFEVGEEVAAPFARAFGEAVVVRQPGGERPHVDLPAVIAVTLARLGVPAGRLDDLRLCTRCDGRFFSHRRDAGRTGRHLSFIRPG